MSGRAYFMDISKLVGLDRSAANRARASLYDLFATLDKKIPTEGDIAMLAFGPNPARRAALAGTVLASLLACAALLCASMTAAEAQELDPWLEEHSSRIDKELAKPTPPTETLLGSPVEMARLTQRERRPRLQRQEGPHQGGARLRAIAPQQICRRSQAREHSTVRIQSPLHRQSNDRTRGRSGGASGVLGAAPVSKNPIGCARWAKDLSWWRTTSCRTRTSKSIPTG